MKRRLAIIVPVLVAIIALGAVLATRATPNAHARGGGWALNSFGPFVDGFCPFRVDFAYLDNQEYSRTQTQPDGTVVIQVNGALKVGVSNDVTGKTVDYNISGPGTITIYPDGSSITDAVGLGIQFFPVAAQQQFGLPAVAYIQGHYVEANDADGNVTSFTDDGAPPSDVCAALS